MASAGRILIMPKGNWSEDGEYEMLDLVYYNGASWIARQTVPKGTIPNDDNNEYWQRMTGNSN